jgi:CheY-like chemotaxis protein
MTPGLCAAILVVEDEDRLRSVITLVLVSEGFHVYSARDGAEALQMFRTMPRPALVLVDLMSPITGVSALFAEMDAADRFVSLPVVVSNAAIAGKEGYGKVKELAGIEDLLPIAASLCLRRN